MFRTIIEIDKAENKRIVTKKVLGVTVSKRVWKIPSEGDLVRITWLPNWRNPFSGRQATNTYIGSVGIVDRLNSDGSFDLRLSGGFLVVGTEYKFERLGGRENIERKS